MSQRADLGGEGFVPGKRNFDVVSSRSNQQGAAQALEFSDVSYEVSVEKNGGAGRVDINLDGGPGGGIGSGGSLLHGDFHGELLAGSEHDALGEVLVAVLAHGDDVLAGEQQDALVAFEFFEVADVLAVDPDAGRSLDFGFSFETKFAHDLISRQERGRQQQSRKRKDGAEPARQRCMQFHGFYLASAMAGLAVGLARFSPGNFDTGQ